MAPNRPGGGWWCVSASGTPKGQHDRSISAISRELRLDRRTVRRFARAADVEDLLGTARSRESLLDAFQPNLHERFNTGQTDASRLLAARSAAQPPVAEPRDYWGRGWRLRRTVLSLPRYPSSLISLVSAAALARRPDMLSEDERLELKQVLDRSPTLTSTYQQVSDKPQKIASEPPMGRRARRHYTELFQRRVESLQSVDDAVARTMAALQDSGELDNTLVIFTSDNGYLLGEHRSARKNLPYEPSLRVPLLMRGPSVPAGCAATRPWAWSTWRQRSRPSGERSRGCGSTGGACFLLSVEGSRGGRRSWSRRARATQTLRAGCGVVFAPTAAPT
jgi:hypothetical protein